MRCGFCNVCGFSLVNLSKYAKSSVLIALVDIQFLVFHIAYLRPPYCIIYFREIIKAFKIAFTYKPEPPTNIT
jgi:hypothetical protein